MSHRSGLLALLAGAALGVATAVALGVGAFEEAAALVVRPVELVDPVPDDPFALDPLFAPGAAARPDPGAEPDAATAATPGHRTIELAGGDVVTIRALDEHALRLSNEDVAFVELAESALGEDGSADARFAVYAVLSDSGREAWAPFAAEHANDFLLIEIAGRPADLVRPLGWSRGLRIGVFADELDRTRYVDSLELEAH